MQRMLVMAACLSAAAGMSAMSPRISWAEPQELRCTLNNSGGAPSAQNEPITVTFDDSAKTLQAQLAGRSYNFADVSISNVAISGDVGTVSLAIDRSSLGLMWQQYGADKVTTEYGQCRQNSASAPAH